MKRAHNCNKPFYQKVNGISAKQSGEVASIVVKIAKNTMFVSYGHYSFHRYTL